MFESSFVSSIRVWKGIVLRFALMAAIWLGLTGNDWKSWVIGLPVVLVSTWLSFRLGPGSSWGWSFRGLVPFCWYFTRQSILSGWDVALRALSTQCRLRPGMISYTLRLPQGPSQLFFCGIVSLLPGTLVTSIDDSTVSIHVLDTSVRQETNLKELEERIAQLFALSKDSEMETP